MFEQIADESERSPLDLAQLADELGYHRASGADEAGEQALGRKKETAEKFWERSSS